MLRGNVVVLWCMIKGICGAGCIYRVQQGSGPCESGESLLENKAVVVSVGRLNVSMIVLCSVSNVQRSGGWFRSDDSLLVSIRLTILKTKDWRL